MDDFSHEKSAALACESGSFGDYGVALHCGLGVTSLATRLLAGIQFHIDESIDVRHRFYKEEPGRGFWSCDISSSNAWTINKGIHIEFLEGIRKPQKLVYEVGDNKGIIDLTGSSGAVAEYKRRCASAGAPIN